VFDRWSRPLLLNDSLYYSAQAIQLADGTFYREVFVDHPGAEHGPLTSTVLALVSWVDAPTPWQRLMTVLFGIATVALVGLLARAVAGDRAGIAATLIAALYPNLWMNDGLVMSESLSLLLVSAILLVTVRTLHAPTRGRAVALGALTGLAALSRSELVLFVPTIALLLWIRARPQEQSVARRLVTPGMLVGVALLVMAPWLVFNLVRFERPVTLTTNDGTTLLGSYCDETFSGDTKGGWSLGCVVNDPEYRSDEEPSVRSSRQRTLARAYASDHIREIPGVVLARLARSADLYALDDLVHQDVGEERYRWASWAGIVSWWLLAPLAIVGVRGLPRRVRPVFAVPAVMVIVVSAVFYGAHRIRSPLEPVVVVLSAVAIASLLGRRSSAESTEPS
jgi:4-amino-4-deoxy-L-arabinose transferase-like glycosyltransferase